MDKLVKKLMELRCFMKIEMVFSPLIECRYEILDIYDENRLNSSTFRSKLKEENISPSTSI